MGVSEKVQELRRELLDKQRSMRVGPNTQGSIDEEKSLRTKLTKWSKIEEDIYKQKSRIQCLKLGDDNNAYFFASMKGRKAQNQINMLTKEDGTVIREATDVTKEAVGFYKKLLGQFDPGQAGFALGRMLTDNVLLSHELVKGGDESSATLMYECFQQFSKVSGLIANQAKSSVYFGGVSVEMQKVILQNTGFVKGLLPFRDLGVPLSSKKLSVGQCQPLIVKILGRITTWTVKFLSYAGRFLWNGETQVKGKALVAWDILCWPKVAGGLNVIDIYMWNKEAILKHLWDLNKKKDKVWIVWVTKCGLYGCIPFTSKVGNHGK
ncbi:hypothetical protein KY284_001420 [Solanum tuberosum]|nr:hypothetical protein KY284_001420 [Solanum tuberosum]